MEENTKKCPFCGEEILAVAKKCKQFLPDEVNDTNVNGFVENSLFRNPYAKAIAIGMAALIFIIIGFSTNSSNPVLSGCNFERKTTYGIANVDFYICKNRPYTSMQIFTDSTGGDPHMLHNVYRKYLDGNYYEDILIAKRTRRDGNYECYSPVTGDTISPCSMAQFKKLAKKGGENLESYKEMSNAKSHINGTLKDIREIRKFYQQDKKYKMYPTNVFLGDLSDPPPPSTINELIEAYEMYYKNNYSIRRFDGSEVPRYVFNGHQAKAPNGNILSFSEDMQYLTIYDSENPKYYFAIKMNFENLDYEVTDKIISADFYIKNSSNMIRVSEEYMDL